MSKGLDHTMLDVDCENVDYRIVEPVESRKRYEVRGSGYCRYK
jgi:hypothetical protein